MTESSLSLRRIDLLEKAQRALQSRRISEAQHWMKDAYGRQGRGLSVSDKFAVIGILTAMGLGDAGSANSRIRDLLDRVRLNKDPDAGSDATG